MSIEIVGTYTSYPQTVSLQDGDVVLWLQYHDGIEFSEEYTLTVAGVTATATLDNYDNMPLGAGHLKMVAKRIELEAAGLYQVSFTLPSQPNPALHWFAVLRGVAAVGELDNTELGVSGETVTPPATVDPDVFGGAQLAGLVAGAPASVSGDQVYSGGGVTVVWTGVVDGAVSLGLSDAAFVLLVGGDGGSGGDDDDDDWWDDYDEGGGDKPTDDPIPPPSPLAPPDPFPPYDIPPDVLPPPPPVDWNPPEITVPPEPTDEVVTPPVPLPPIDDLPPESRQTVYLLVRIGAESYFGTMVSTVTHNGRPLACLGWAADSTGLEQVEIWGLGMPDTDIAHPVVVRFDGLMAGVVVAVQMLWNVDQLNPVAGWAANSGTTSPHSLPFVTFYDDAPQHARGVQFTIFDVIAGDGIEVFVSADTAADENPSKLIRDYYAPAPIGNSFYPATMLCAGGHKTGRFTSGVLTYISTSRIWVHAALAFTPAGMPRPPYQPIETNPPTVVAPDEPTDEVETPPVPDPPEGDETGVYLLVRVGAEITGGAQLTSVTHHGKALSRLGRAVDDTGLEMVEMWGVVAPDLGEYAVVVQFDQVVTGIVVAAQMLWHVDRVLSTAGWLSASGAGTTHVVSFRSLPYYTIFGVFAADGAQPFNLSTVRQETSSVIVEYDEEAPTGDDPLYSPTMRSAGGYQTNIHTHDFRLFSATARVWVVGIVAFVPEGLPSDLPPFVDLDPDPDTPDGPPYTDPSTDPNAGDESPATPACTVSGCVFVGNTSIALHGMVANRLLVTGNAFTDFSLQALLLDRCDASLVEGNLFSQGLGTAVVVGAGWRVTVRDNHIQDVALSGSAGAYAIELSNCRYALVQGNRVTARDVRPRYAVHVDTYCDSVAVVDNDFRHGYSVDLVGDTGLRSYVVRNLPEPSFWEQVQDVVGAMVVDTVTVKAVYDDQAGVLGLYVISRTVDADKVDGLHADDLLDKTTYDSDDDGVVEHAALADSVPWSGVMGTPAAYPSESHEHDWDEVTGKPTVYPPETHEHALAGLSDVQVLAPVDGQALVYVAAQSKWQPGTVAAAAGAGELLVDAVGNILFDDDDDVLVEG